MTSTKEVSLIIYFQQGCCNHCWFQPKYGQMFPWISLGVYPSKGKDTILVVVDRLTKYAHFILLSHPYTAPEVAAVFLQEVVRLHGFPATIVSDKDSLFLSQFWKELFKASGTQLKFSTTYHSQTDGQTEVVNRCIEAYLRCLTGSRPKN